jgi:DNA-binding transcriptional regulator GbsR (MarR family)
VAVRSERAEAIRLRLADAWGEMGAAWGVAPAIARVHAYLMARAEPLTEREVRQALGLSHRAASVALAEAVGWGIVERVEARRVGRRGPAGVAFQAIGNHWEWFARVISERKVREGDPIIGALERTLGEAALEAAARPDDRELAALAAWLGEFNDFVHLFDRAVDLVPAVDPAGLERLLRLVARLPDERVLRLFELLEAVPAEDILAVLDALGRLSPATATTATKAMGRVLRPFAR